MNDLVKKEHLLPDNKSYVASLKDLQDIFPKLPSADKWPNEYIGVKVQVDMFAERSLGYGFSIQGSARKDFAEIFFTKFQTNGNAVWIYEGKVGR